MSTAKLILRPSSERGHANHGWLKTFHSFSFASYADYDHMSFGHLRVINEDRVESGTGFGTHPHREFEIFSYVIDGELEHEDSMGNIEVLKRGDLQMTSTGTGIKHSEKCHGPKQNHFLQIWAKPNESNLPPKYYTRHFSDDDKKDKWAHVVAPAVKDSQDTFDKREATGPAPVHSPLDVFATILSPTASLSHTAERTNVYAHLTQRSGYNPGPASGATVKIDVGGDSVQLREGDGVYITLTPGTKVDVENIGERDGELLLFDNE
ncbi:pirin domain-containing protein [Thelephora ganbajun]|uniref:Pirin domain-containing protein n=1 Tax=Thelephora ganbajun TaxID=370292 RepID=A0ACB6ZI91_THEGA|nr:pirin domain-containing protein [Thelephora ganbajun]